MHALVYARVLALSQPTHRLMAIDYSTVMVRTRTALCTYDTDADTHAAHSSHTHSKHVSQVSVVLLSFAIIHLFIVR